GNITGIKEERQLTNDENVNWCPYWHPDGHHLIFATSRQGHTNYELYTMRDDGSHVTRVTYTDGFDGLQAFSADGKRVMWSAKRTKDNTTQLFIGRYTNRWAGWTSTSAPYGRTLMNVVTASAVAPTSNTSSAHR